MCAIVRSNEWTYVVFKRSYWIGIFFFLVVWQLYSYFRQVELF